MNQDWNSYNYMPYTVSHMWKRDSEDSETTRTKRDAEDKDRAKRQMTGSSMWPWQNRWSWDGYSPSSNWNQFYNMPFRSLYEGGQYWKRDTENEFQDIRSKRSADEMGREKRNMMMNWPNWNNWYSQYMWNRPYGWHDYDFPMWKRNSDQDTENSRSKRDAEELEREKRQENFGWPWQWYSHLGPNFAQHMWNPHFRRGNSEVSGSHMSKREFSDEMFHSQTKRDTTGEERKKRFKMMWNSGSPWQQSYPYNDWNTYQSWQPSWFGYGSSMWRRDSEENNDNARSKRDTENVNRKRRFGMVYDWDMPWQRFNSWNPYYMSNWFSYGNHMWKREGDEDSMANRERRDTGEAGKEKRQGSVGNSWSGHGFSRPWRWNLPSGDWQMYRWNNFNSWPGWNSNFYSLRKRHGDLNVDGSRTRREANKANREKRYGGNWNSSPYSWNWSWNFPYNNWFRSSYSNWPSWSWRRDMWKRGAQGQSGDVQNENVSRNKRDVSEENRNKRYAMMWSSFDNPWSSQWYYPSSEWYMPDWFGGNGFWKRETQDSSEQQERTRRDTGESNKVKRQGMMSPHWGGGFSQSYYPSNNWDMHSNWNSYNGFSGHWAYGTNRGWKRDTEKRKESSRIKREADDTARTKRMGGMMWDSWPWQWQSPWWRPSYYWGRGMWKREEQGGGAQFREKREIASGDEDKWMTNMKDRKAEPSKRQYSYNKKTSGSSKTMNSEDSVWRSAKKSYDEQNSWQRRLDQENSNWHHGTNKWGDKAVPNTYSTASWMQTPTTGRGYSWQSTPSSYPSGGYNRAGGMRTNSMPSGWYGGVHMGGDSYGQPYNTQWRSMYGDAAMSGYWPVDWDNAFGPYGIYGFSPLSMRLFREAQAKREAQDSGDAKSGIDESETLLPQKRHAEESKGKKILDRKKRFSHFFNPMFNFYKYQKMRQMRASWFFHSFCQRPAWWGPQSMGLFKRNATNTAKDQSFFNPTKQTPTAAQWLDSEKEKRQGRLYNNPGSGIPFPGTQDRNRFQMWQFYAWMCPRAWHVMQGNFISPGGFSQGFPTNNFPQGTVNPYFRSLPFQPRWKRSNPSGSTGGGYDDARDRRQWGNYWRGWPRGHGPEDCEEWVSPMPAWSPWRGWNMLRKNRGETSSTEAREKREADQDLEKDKRAAYRCRNWHGGRFYDPNMNMGMGNRMSPNRFGMDSWRSNWMDANRWGSRRYRRETPSGGDGGDTSGREKRWQEPGTWFPGYGPPQFGPWSHFNFWSQW